MPTLVLDPPPVQLEQLLEHRRRIGADTHDEVWEGVYHMVPGPGLPHSMLVLQLAEILAPFARRAGLHASVEFNLGVKDDFRVPDLGVHRNRPHGTGIWIATAAIVVEVLSPGDETWKKLPFFAAHEVDELLVVDPDTKSVAWYSLQAEGYEQVERSEIIDLSATELTHLIDWPPAD
jgi:Uma2 family endonuclease